MTDRPEPRDDDPLLAEILAIAAQVDRDALRVDLDDPVFVGLVDRAVAPYERLMTLEGLAEARETATMALATRSDIEALLSRERERLARQGSGVQPVRSADRLAEVTRRKRGTGAR